MISSAIGLCLAIAIYAESRGESDQGKIAVANVIVNRAEHSNKNICKVINQKGQFTWNKRIRVKDHQSFLKCIEIANKTLNREYSDNTKGATFFHATRVKPAWRRKLIKTTKIDNHIFYKIDDRRN